MTPSPLRFLLLVSLLVLRNCRVECILRLPHFVADHMVLQRAPQQARLWGWTSTMMTTITASIDDGRVIGRAKTQKGANDTEMYYWEMDLEPQPPSVNVELVLREEPSSSKSSSDDDDETMDSITLHDIAFGDVYLCAGQSNMEMSVSDVFDADHEANDSRHYPHLRLATVQRTRANTTQADVLSKGPQSWWRSGPQAVIGGGSFGYFSAACYFAGRTVYTALGGLVPIGLVTSSWGGQSVEAFSSRDALEDPTCGGTIDDASTIVVSAGDVRRGDSTLMMMVDDDDDDDAFVDDGPQPTQLWFGMITPLLPMRLSGILWYQGERNAGDPGSYACRFPAMIADWRTQFGYSDLPFVFVQLAAFNGNDFSWIRAAQEAALDLDRVREVVAIDLGDPTAPHGSIHSRRKQEVGRRLGLELLQEVYGMGAGSGGPQLVDVDIRTTGSSKVVLQLQLGHAPDPILKGTAACSECCYELPFETLDSVTGNWTRVTQTVGVGDNELLLQVETNAPVVGVRYGWEGYPQCAVYDTTHPKLPMAPFQWCRYGGELPPWIEGSCDLGSPAARLRPMSDETFLLRGS